MYTVYYTHSRRIALFCESSLMPVILSLPSSMVSTYLSISLCHSMAVPAWPRFNCVCGSGSSWSYVLKWPCQPICFSRSKAPFTSNKCSQCSWIRRSLLSLDSSVMAAKWNPLQFREARLSVCPHDNHWGGLEQYRQAVHDHWLLIQVHNCVRC